MSDLSYYDTLITVAADCPVDRSAVPQPRGGKPTVAVSQYEMLVDRPFVHTQADVLFGVWRQRHGGAELDPREVAALRSEFFGKSQACLRASPLSKRYGFGLLFDSQGRISLCPMESDRYRELLGGEEVTLLAAMRSRRA